MKGNYSKRYHSLVMLNKSIILVLRNNQNLMIKIRKYINKSNKDKIYLQSLMKHHIYPNLFPKKLKNNKILCVIRILVIK